MSVYLGRAKRICYLSPMRAAKVQASLRIRAVSPEPSLLAHTNSESRGTFRQKARSLAPLNGWACAVEICHDGMLEDTNSLDGAHLLTWALSNMSTVTYSVFLGKQTMCILICNCCLWEIIEPRYDKTNKMAVCPAKTRIRLGIRPVWSASSLSTWRNLGSLATH